MPFRVPIGLRIHRATHARIKRIAHELGVPNGEVVDLAIAMLPVAQCEMTIGAPRRVQPIRAHLRRRPRRVAIGPEEEGIEAMDFRREPAREGRRPSGNEGDIDRPVTAMGRLPAPPPSAQRPFTAQGE
jgi:hypothetical protein